MAGMTLAAEAGADLLNIHSDSQLVIDQLDGTFTEYKEILVEGEKVTRTFQRSQDYKDTKRTEQAGGSIV